MRVHHTLFILLMGAVAAAGVHPHAVRANDELSDREWIATQRERVEALGVDPEALEEAIHESDVKFLQVNVEIDTQNVERVATEIGQIRGQLLLVDRNPDLLQDSATRQRVRRDLDALPQLREQARVLRNGRNANAALLERVRADGPRRVHAVRPTLTSAHRPLALGLREDGQASSTADVSLGEVQAALWETTP